MLEFSQDIPSTGFITLSFYEEQTRSVLGSVPTAQLGTRTLKANFPGKSSEGVEGISTLDSSLAFRWYEI